MITHCETLISPSSKLSCSPTVTAFDASLNKCVKNFKDLLSEYEQVLTELESCRHALSKQSDLCATKNCSAAEFLLKDKENILQSVASALTQLNETRDWSYIEGIFRLLFGETTPAQPKQSTGDRLTEFAVSKASPLKTNTPNKKIIKKEKLTPIKQSVTPERNVKLTFYTKDITKPIKEKSPQKDLSSSLEDISFKDESISEIVGTPKARSPVLENKRRKNQSVHSLLASSSDNSDGGKRKGPETWKNPDPKQQKTNVVLTPRTSKQNPTSSAKKKLTQMRFTSMLMRNDDVVDLTSSPEFSGGTRGDNKGPVKSLIKTESSETEETILPSPTSNPAHEYTMFKPIKDKDSQTKFKKPLSLKHKNESTIDPKHETVPNPKDHKNEPKLLLNDTKNSENYQKDLKNDMKDLENDLKDFKNDSKDIVSMDHDPMESIVVSYVPNKKSDGNCGDLETSVNILNPNRFKSPKKSPPKPDQAVADLNIDYDITHCDSFNDMKDDKENCRIEKSTDIVKSPIKRPLGDSNNVSNIPENADSSMSLLTRAEVKADNVKRRSPEKVEPVYKEPTVRKKSEKMALPAWLCEECKAFTDALYDDPDPEKVKAIIQACGKHRGRRNPVRPKTPPGFWEVRWTVPEDTEEFNRKNNAS